MCTPVYVTVKAASTMAPIVSYLVGAAVLGIGSALCFFKAFRSKSEATS